MHLRFIWDWILTPHAALDQSAGQSPDYQSLPWVRLAPESNTLDQPWRKTALRGILIVPFASGLLGDTGSWELLSDESAAIELVQPELPTEWPTNLKTHCEWSLCWSAESHRWIQSLSWSSCEHPHAASSQPDHITPRNSHWSTPLLRNLPPPPSGRNDRCPAEIHRKLIAKNLFWDLLLQTIVPECGTTREVHSTN